MYHTQHRQEAAHRICQKQQAIENKKIAEHTVYGMQKLSTKIKIRSKLCSKNLLWYL